MRRLLILLASLLIASAFVLPADAGVGWSQYCTDGVTYGSGGQEVPILNWPITLNLDAGVGDPNYLIVCYSTTPNGDSSPTIIGGHVWYAGDNENVHCREDSNSVIGLPCAIEFGNGVVVAVRPRVQGTSFFAGVSSGGLEAPACLRSVLIDTQVGALGPFDVGACTP